MGAGIAAVASGLAHESLKGETGKAVAVGGAISLVGVIAFFKGSAERDLPENRDYNVRLRQQWLAQRDSIIAENRSRLAQRYLIIEPAEAQR